MRCLKNRFYCKEELRLIDCSRANLMVVPKSLPLVNYTTLNLRHNLLVQVNLSVLEVQLPNLKMVDLRDNPFDCKRFPEKTILGVITDCEITVTRKTLKTNPKTTRLPSSHAGTSTRKTLKARKLTQPTTARLPSSHPGTSIIIYMTVLFSSSLSFCRGSRVEGRGFHVKGRGYHVEGNFFFQFCCCCLINIVRGYSNSLKSKEP